MSDLEDELELFRPNTRWRFYFILVTFVNFLHRMDLMILKQMLFIFILLHWNNRALSFTVFWHFRCKSLNSSRVSNQSQQNHASGRQQRKWILDRKYFISNFFRSLWLCFPLWQRTCGWAWQFRSQFVSMANFLIFCFEIHFLLHILLHQ